MYSRLTWLMSDQYRQNNSVSDACHCTVASRNPNLLLGWDVCASHTFWDSSEISELNFLLPQLRELG